MEGAGGNMSKHNDLIDQKDTQQESSYFPCCRRFPIGVMDSLMLFVSHYEFVLAKSHHIDSRLQDLLDFTDNPEGHPHKEAMALINDEQNKLMDEAYIVTESTILAAIDRIKDAIEPLLDGIAIAAQEDSIEEVALVNYFAMLMGGVESIYFAYSMGKLVDRCHTEEIKAEDIDTATMFKVIYEDNQQAQSYHLFMNAAISFDVGQINEWVNEYLSFREQDPVDIESPMMDAVYRANECFAQICEDSFPEDTAQVLSSLMDHMEQLEEKVHHMVDYEVSGEEFEIALESFLDRLRILTVLYEEGMKHFILIAAIDYDNLS